MDNAFEDAQFFRTEILKDRDVLKDFGQRLLAWAISENVSPYPVGLHTGSDSNVGTS